MSKQPYIYRYVDVEIAIATAREQEREHIIKLLKELRPKRKAYQMPMDYWVERRILKKAIALIEGQKDNETVVLLTQNDWKQLSKAIGETE